MIKKNRLSFVSSLFISLAYILLIPSNVYAETLPDIKSRFLGFSSDGYTYAYEEYGFHERSKAPYAVVHFVSTRDNKDVYGSPMRVQNEKSNSSLFTVRNIAQQISMTYLRHYKIQTKGRLLFHNHNLDILNRKSFEEVVHHDDSYVDIKNIRLHVHSFHLPTRHCSSYGKGFQYGYILTIEQKNTPPIYLHKDNKIPRTRGCPKEYAISDVISFKNYRYVVLVKVISHSVSHNTDGSNEGDRFVAYSFFMKNKHKGETNEDTK